MASPNLGKQMVDSGLTSTYISDHVAQVFDLIMNDKEGYEQLTLVEGWKVQA